MRLIDSTVKKMAKPGKVTVHQASRM